MIDGEEITQGQKNAAERLMPFKSATPLTPLAKPDALSPALTGGFFFGESKNGVHR
jgi:hypothetical protein